MSVCISAASIWVAASAVAPGDALERCVEAREAVRSGVLTVYQVWDLGDATIEREETAYFDGEQYRLDIHWDSSNSQVFELRGEASDPLAILIWDGRQVLSRMAAYGARQRWSIRELDRTRFPFYNARMLGLAGPARTGMC
jgi:hypothetical protein